MSLVAMKRKAGIKTSRVSSIGSNGFSINNPRRIEDRPWYVPQSQTPHRGATPRGHGSTLGNYPINIVKSNKTNYSPEERDFTVQGSNTGISVKSALGGRDIRFKWMKSVYPNYIHKDMNDNTHSYQQHLSQLKSQHASTNQGTVAVSLSDSDANCTTCSIAKRVGPVDQSEYIFTGLLTKNCLPSKNSQKHFPVPMPNRCSSSTYTQAEIETMIQGNTESGNCS